MNPTNDPHDDELRGLLREMGRAGERRAPSFQRIWHAAHQPHEPAVSHWRPGWAAVAGVIVLFVFAMQDRQPAPVIEGDTRSDEALPTDFLLTMNNDDPVERLAEEISALLRP